MQRGEDTGGHTHGSAAHARLKKKNPRAMEPSSRVHNRPRPAECNAPILAQCHAHQRSRPCPALPLTNAIAGTCVCNNRQQQQRQQRQPATNAAHLESGAQATLDTQLAWPVNVDLLGAVEAATAPPPVRASHTRTAMSGWPVATRLPNNGVHSEVTTLLPFWRLGGEERWSGEQAKDTIQENQLSKHDKCPVRKLCAVKNSQYAAATNQQAASLSNDSQSTQTHPPQTHRHTKRLPRSTHNVTTTAHTHQ